MLWNLIGSEMNEEQVGPVPGFDRSDSTAEWIPIRDGAPDVCVDVRLVVVASATRTKLQRQTKWKQIRTMWDESARLDLTVGVSDFVFVHNIALGALQVWDH